MALGKQVAPVSSIVTFALWARRAGLSVGEMYGFSTVHKVHAAGSWHYDRSGDHGLAADINHPAGGAVERAALVRAVDVAHSLGLAVIYARDGVRGEAGAHQTHLHVDCGPYSHLGGTGSFKPVPGGDRVTGALQDIVRAGIDLVWGPDTDRRLELVRAASVYRGHTFPQGVAETQRVVGAVPDGDWGSRSAAAHDVTVAAIQRVLGVADDGIWGKYTDGAYAAARDIRHRI